MENREYMSPAIASVGPTTQAVVVLRTVAAVTVAVAVYTVIGMSDTVY